MFLGALKLVKWHPNLESWIKPWRKGTRFDNVIGDWFQPRGPPHAILILYNIRALIMEAGPYPGAAQGVKMAAWHALGCPGMPYKSYILV